MFKIGINSNNECGKDYKSVLDNIKSVGFTNVMLSAKGKMLEESI